MAKALELIGAATVGTGACFGVFQDDMRREFLYLGIGGVIFFLGWLLEGRRSGA
ncbi:MAG: hypothetical protein IT345_12055 [Trueperaceae bacterium]|nr:hypothetical protein [Trueperaceae bacterium]